VAVAVARYNTHPEVIVDAAVAVDRWVLSERGLARLGRLLEAQWVETVGRIVCSAETKARQTASVLAGRRGLPIEIRALTGEIDRSATGFLPPEEHEACADACFARPVVTARGWERAVDAQRRIAVALEDLFADDQASDVAVVGHGGVGTLWFCYLAGVRIERRWDQPHQGHYFSVDLDARFPAAPLAAVQARRSAITGSDSRTPGFTRSVCVYLAKRVRAPTTSRRRCGGRAQFADFGAARSCLVRAFA
jgi:broad specificity phosphatase PhoE